MTKQVIVVTGASSGFDALTARPLALAGHAVFAGMRATTGRNAPQVEAVAAYAAEHGVDLRAIELDVQSDASVEAGIAQIIADCDRLDVVIHNAGHMSVGPAEAFTPEQFAELYDINVLSTRRFRNCAGRARAWCCGCRPAACVVARRPISPPVSRRRRRWTVWR